MENVTEQSAAELIQQAISVLYCCYESIVFVEEEVTTEGMTEAIELLKLALEKVEEDRENMLDQGWEEDLYG